MKILTESEFRDLEKYISKLRKEIELCAQCGAYLAGCFMAGALLEALLLAMSTVYPEETERARLLLNEKNRKITNNPKKWTLNDLLHIAFEAGWLPFEGTMNPNKGRLGDWLLNFVKEMRNWIHPGIKIRKYKEIKVTKKHFIISKDLVYAVSDVLLNKITTDLLKKLK
ncbi:MAG: hypothetical protein ABIL40_02240 [candidate division WOR-3 bacterium]